MKLQKEKNLTMLFIAHDLVYCKTYIRSYRGNVSWGKLVETSQNPAKLYVEAKTSLYAELFYQSVPIADPEASSRKSETSLCLKGDVPSPVESTSWMQICRTL